jgi:hypothetical protein
MSHDPLAILDLFEPGLKDLNPRNPDDRKRILDAEARLEIRLARAQRLVDTDTFTSGNRHSERLIANRDRAYAQCVAIFRLRTEASAGSDPCRSAACSAPAGETYLFSGYCESCFALAQQGRAPEVDPTALPKPYIGSVWGQYERTA